MAALVLIPSEFVDFVHKNAVLVVQVRTIPSTISKESRLTSLILLVDKAMK